VYPTAVRIIPITVNGSPRANITSPTFVLIAVLLGMIEDLKSGTNVNIPFWDGGTTVGTISFI
jgi:hypothetical protein